MTSTSLHGVSYCLILFMAFIGPGDGRWRRRAREKLDRDIVIFRKIADEIESDIDDFYDHYADEEKDEDPYAQDYSRVSFEGDKPYVSEFVNIIPKTDNNNTTSSGLNNDSEKQKEIHTSTTSTTVNSKQGDTTEHWPNFNDMLLSLGKKYDWKNDRWIKVKVKKNINYPTVNADDKDSIVKATLNKNNSLEDRRKAFLAKHNFSYRMVRLSSRKSKRNIIVAVKAVR